MVTFDLDVTGSGFGFAHFTLVPDNIPEGEECLVITVRVDEAQLDPRDQGQVDVFDLTLFRIFDASGEDKLSI